MLKLPPLEVPTRGMKDTLKGETTQNAIKNCESVRLSNTAPKEKCEESACCKWQDWTKPAESLFLVCFFVFFCSVHFYWGSARNKVFCYHSKSRDGRQRSLQAKLAPRYPHCLVGSLGSFRNPPQQKGARAFTAFQPKPVPVPEFHWDVSKIPGGRWPWVHKEILLNEKIERQTPAPCFQIFSENACMSHVFFSSFFLCFGEWSFWV